VEVPRFLNFFAETKAQQLTPTEREFADMIADVWGDRIDELLGILRAGGDVPNIPEQWWSDLETTNRELFLAHLQTRGVAGVESGRRVLEAVAPRLAIAVNWDLPNQNVISWAREYSVQLAAGVTDTIADRWSNALADWVESGEPFSALREKAEEIFVNRAQAEAIAVTETTRAVAEGNTTAWMAAGVWGRRWDTAEDDLVCPICGGLNGQVQPMGAAFRVDVGEKLYTPHNPPAHPRCRCVVTPILQDPQAEAERERAEAERPIGELKDLTTLKEMERWGREHYPNIQFDFEGAHVDTIRPTLEQFDKLAQEYPDVAARLEYVGTYKGEGAPGRGFQQNSNTYAHASHDGTRIGLNPEWYGDPEIFELSLRDCREGGWLARGVATPEGIITHEFGHQVNHHLLSIKDSMTPEAPWSGYTTINTAKRSFVHANKPTNRLSRYGLTKPAEAWAEGFASLYHTPPRNHTKYARRLRDFLEIISTSGRYEDPTWVWMDDATDETRALINRLRNLGIGEKSQW
jgi:SPP1 gp7 family putative phage head morphogenesis protein